jgi:hypothetical protein
MPLDPSEPTRGRPASREVVAFGARSQGDWHSQGCRAVAVRISAVRVEGTFGTGSPLLVAGW